MINLLSDPNKVSWDEDHELPCELSKVGKTLFMFLRVVVVDLGICKVRVCLNRIEGNKLGSKQTVLNSFTEFCYKFVRNRVLQRKEVV